MNLNRCSLSFLVIPLTVTSARADVLDVGGPTPDHAQIQAAVNAAQDGDVIRIWPGTYQPFTILNESLTLVKATTGGSVNVAGTMRIRELAPGRTVVVSGIYATGSDGRGLVVSDCQGSVRIRDGSFTGADGTLVDFSIEGKPGALITNCSDVELTDCVLRAGDPTSGWEYAGWGGAGLELEASTLSAFHSQFLGSSGGYEDDPGASGASGGHGIQASGGGRAYVSGCTLTGGDGGDADVDPDFWTGEYGYGGDAGWGFRAFGFVDAWFLDNVYQPGSAGSSPAPGHQGLPGQATSGGVHLPGVSRSLRASALRSDVESIGLRFEGAPGDLLFLRLATAPDYQFSPVYGPVLLAAPPLAPLSASDPWIPSQGWRFVGALGATGILNASIPARELPAFDHGELHFQAVHLGAETYFGSSSWSVLLDAAW